MAKQQSDIRERTRLSHDIPRMYRVIMHNDDFTTMEFVVDVLRKVFFKPEEEANQLMLKVHKEGKATVGLYTLDIAVSKSQKAMRMARDQGFPFKLTWEPEERDLPF
jgi:ATP-dependent Clp protease adaptor protein ClpS